MMAYRPRDCVEWRVPVLTVAMEMAGKYSDSIANTFYSLISYLPAMFISDGNKTNLTCFGVNLPPVFSRILFTLLKSLDSFVLK